MSVLILAAQPWSPATHNLFPAPARARAVALMRVGHLLSRSGRFEREEVGRALLGYYDALYDKHLLNGTGQGSGDGARPGAVLEAAQPDDAPALDDAELARAVLRCVADFEAAEAAAPPKVAPEVGASEVAPPEAEEEGGEQAACAFQ